MRKPALALTAALALTVTAPAAHAEIFAVTDGLKEGVGLDVQHVNAVTGTRFALPAAVSSSSDENVYPSISNDGKRMVFERRNTTAGTVRIIVVDLTTGQSADLFNGFETAANPPRSPSITPAGDEVLTGGPLQPGASGKLAAQVTLTDLTSFPNGPYPRTTYQPQYDFAGQSGDVAEPLAVGSEAGSLLAFRVTRPGVHDELVLGQLGGPASPPLVVSDTDVTHPSFGKPGGVTTVVFDQRKPPAPADIAFRTLGSVAGFPGQPTLLPAIVNSPATEYAPAFTPDGRYLAFLRRTSTGDMRDRLFVWDSQTQTLLNPSGVDVGVAANPDLNNVSLYTRPLLRSSEISFAGRVSFSLLQPTGVGLLVQRVIGRHRLFGRSVPTLKPVGRVPLGKFHKGQRKAHWNLRVNGRPLPRGTYQVTVRALTGKGQIRDLGKPKILHGR
jgi:hypothetical protein